MQKVFSIDNIDSVVFIQAQSRCILIRWKTPNQRRRDKKELILPSMDGRREVGNERQTLSRAKEPPPIGLKVWAKNEESTKERRSEIDRNYVTQ